MADGARRRSQPVSPAAGTALPRQRASRRDRTDPDDPAAVRYRIVPADPAGHLYEVLCDIAAPDPDGQTLTLPAWIPGSYMIREFARHIVSIAASSGGDPVPLTKRDKHTWRAARCSGPLRIVYRVYAWDPSVRAAHLDETHGFFNGTSVFLRVEGRADGPHDVELAPPPGRAFRDWRVATTLPEHGAARLGFGGYRAPDYDALIDHPVEMGRFRFDPFDAAGVPHAIAYTGAVPNLDAARVTEDLARLCAAQIRFFSRDDANAAAAGAPFDRYLFLTAVTADGYGGLEHRASTALQTTRDALPVALAAGSPPAPLSNGYLTFLGLASHEYFHSWNVKRIKPAAFVPYDLTRENYTSLLWIFEGFTSYYDDLFLVRTDLATRPQYVAMLGKTIDDVLAGSGRRGQSVAESSFDAWIKYYRQDENTPNAVVSYYKKGSLVALCLDLLLRQRSGGASSLDDVMRLMWRRHGRRFDESGDRRDRTGVGEADFPVLVREATGIDADDAIGRWAYGTEDLPLAALLAPFGVALRFEPAGALPSIGARIGGTGEARLTHVMTGGAAHRAGLSAGDVLVAIDDLRVDRGRFDARLARYRPGDVVDVAAFRGDVLQRRSLTFDAPPQRAVLDLVGKPTKSQARLQDRWLRVDGVHDGRPRRRDPSDR